MAPENCTNTRNRLVSTIIIGRHNSRPICFSIRSYDLMVGLLVSKLKKKYYITNILND